WRDQQPFTDLRDLTHRTGLTTADLQQLAAADALRTIAGHRHQARWQAAVAEPASPLLQSHDLQQIPDELITLPPGEEKNIQADYSSTGLTLRAHPMALLRSEAPFNRCKKQTELIQVGHGRFI